MSIVCFKKCDLIDSCPSCSFSPVALVLRAHRVQDLEGQLREQSERNEGCFPPPPASTHYDGGVEHVGYGMIGTTSAAAAAAAADSTGKSVPLGSTNTRIATTNPLQGGGGGGFGGGGGGGGSSSLTTNHAQENGAIAPAKTAGAPSSSVGGRPAAATADVEEGPSVDVGDETVDVGDDLVVAPSASSSSRLGGNSTDSLRAIVAAPLPSPSRTSPSRTPRDAPSPSSSAPAAPAPAAPAVVLPATAAVAAASQAVVAAALSRKPGDVSGDSSREPPPPSSSSTQPVAAGTGTKANAEIAATAAAGVVVVADKKAETSADSPGNEQRERHPAAAAAPESKKSAAPDENGKSPSLRLAATKGGVDGDGQETDRVDAVDSGAAAPDICADGDGSMDDDDDGDDGVLL